MSPLLTLFGVFALVVGVLGGAYALISAELVARFLRQTSPSSVTAPAVTLLKPLSGAEPGLAERLASFMRQDYAGAVQIIFGVQDLTDPAAQVVRALQAAHPEIDSVLVIDSTQYGANRKISNLINMTRRARHRILVVSDSDMAAPPDYLRQVTATLQRPKVGVVTCVYAGQPEQGLWARLGAMGINYQFLPNVILGARLGLAEPCMGSTIALRRETLAQIGGFEAFRDHLADDFEIGRAVRALGYQIAVPPLVLGHGCHETSAPDLFRHEIRWGRTIRLINGAGYFGSFVTYALPLGLIGAALLGFSEVSLALVLAILISRLILKLRIDAAVGNGAGGTGAVWLLPLRDVLSFAVFLASLTGASISWRGRRYRVGPDGVLAPL